ncbi:MULTISPECIES: sugar phosphate nucleotidyltransferase [unclassified Vibrio]|uniref:sugar phosphate nucleotidyltransferase n=1 Tax=unclassified Vibrio TaxID=2614977 RepID=UPI0025566986|nr:MULTISPECIES: sugar phosphate nucleotidyltransferase [unclassified Vibrio]MDK9778716.1 glucose-1-phosphate adenylyltransferase [Vibrio sp. D401a]MDK9803250.1 glucose-1-phosphate adenylyltransferase [Vibrio sp. D406a]
MAKVMSLVLVDKERVELGELTHDCCKATLPFLGGYKIIDFTIDSLLRANIKNNIIMSRVICKSLKEHINDAWQNHKGDVAYLDSIYNVKSSQEEITHQDWLDVFLQNIAQFNQPSIKQVLLLSGEQIHGDYFRQLQQYHTLTRADMTLVVSEVDIDNASLYHVVELSDSGEVVAIHCHPEEAPSLPSKPNKALVLAGSMLLNKERLVKAVFSAAKEQRTGRDFVMDIIVPFLTKTKVSLFNLGGEKNQPIHWSPIKSIEEYWFTQIHRLSEPSEGSGRDNQLKCFGVRAKNNIEFKDIGRDSVRLKNSIISSGSKIYGSRVLSSVVGINSILENNAIIYKSVLMGDNIIGKGCRISNAIIEEGAHIAPYTVIGENIEQDQMKYNITPNGIIIIPKGSRIGFYPDKVLELHSI